VRIIYTDKEAEVEEIIFLHAMAKVERNKPRRKRRLPKKHLLLVSMKILIPRNLSKNKKR
jgi:hypothetical protein